MKDEETRKTLNQIRREKTKAYLLADILTDLNVCKLEGWNCNEYLIDLKNLIEGIIKINEKGD